MALPTFADAGGLTLHYRLDGPTGAPYTLVFINALGSSLHVWDEAAAFLSGIHRVLLYDKRGHGLSDAPPAPYRMRDHASDLLALLDTLKLGKVVLVGISVGGMIAQDFASAFPDRVQGLVLCDTGLKIGTTEFWNERIQAVQRGELARLAPSIMSRWFTAKFFEQHPEAAQSYLNVLEWTTPDGYAGTCAALRDTDLRAQSARLKVPALVLCGAQDLSTPPDLNRELAKVLGAPFHLIQEAAHIASVEQPAAIAGHIQAFVDRIAPPAPPAQAPGAAKPATTPPETQPKKPITEPPVPEKNPARVYPAQATPTKAPDGKAATHLPGFPPQAAPVKPEAAIPLATPPVAEPEAAELDAAEAEATEPETVEPLALEPKADAPSPPVSSPAAPNPTVPNPATSNSPTQGPSTPLASAYEAGLSVRRYVLGEEHVAQATGNTTDFDRDFQRYITETAWGGPWVRGTLNVRERHLITLAVLTTLADEQELELYIRATRNTGITPDELRELIMQVSVYAGVSAANRAIQIAKRVLAEELTEE